MRVHPASQTRELATAEQRAEPFTNPFKMIVAVLALAALFTLSLVLR